MSKQTIVKISNKIGIISIILLIYWVFTFILVTVFDFKIFRQNLTQIFYFSVMAILALMLGALILNIMSNLTIIANTIAKEKQEKIKKSLKLKWTFFAIFPLLFGFLFFSDIANKNKREKYLKDAAAYSISEFSTSTNNIINLPFDKNKCIQANNLAKLIQNSSSIIEGVLILSQEKVMGKKMFVSLEKHYYSEEEKKQPLQKINYLFKADKEQKQYLKSVFENNNKNYKFSSSDSNYELFYPYFYNGKCLVFYFKNYSRYGKFGS